MQIFMSITRTEASKLELAIRDSANSLPDSEALAFGGVSFALATNANWAPAKIGRPVRVI